MKKFVEAVLWFSVAQFVVLLITGLFGITPIEETFFPTLGMVAFFGMWNAINRDRQKKRDWVEANARHREAMLAGGKRASWPPQRPADAGAEFHVEADLDRLRNALFKSGASRPARSFTDHSKKPTTRTPDQYSRRTDKPVEMTTSTSEMPITNPAHPLYGSTFGNTNADSYPAKTVVADEVHRAPCAMASVSDTATYSPPCSDTSSGSSDMSSACAAPSCD